MKENTTQSFQFTQPAAADSRSARPGRSGAEEHVKSPAGFTANNAPGTRRVCFGGRCIGYTHHSVGTLRGIAAAWRSLYNLGN